MQFNQSQIPPRFNWNMLRFQPACSRIDASFWHELAERKLNSLQLSEEPVPLQAKWRPSRYDQVPSPIFLDGSSFDMAGNLQLMHGRLINLNLMDSFRNFDKSHLMKEAARSIWASITSGEAEKNPSVISSLLLLSHADLKQYRFYYHMSCPALKPPSPFLIHRSGSNQAEVNAETLLNHLKDPVKARGVAESCDAWFKSPETQPLWLLDKGSNKCLPFSSWPSFTDETNHGSLSDRFSIAFSDPSNDPSHPGWPLRNFLLLAAFSLPQSLRRINVICVREGSNGRVSPDRSLVLDVELPTIPSSWSHDEEDLIAVGWEADDQGKQAARCADLSSLMDPLLLAEQALGLNLKLMKWRAAPALDVDAMAATRCLLVGAGTLGCAVARTLLAWGVKKITFADSSKVAYSNPPRQWLFEHEDSKESRPKAAAAAASLKRILPSLDTSGLSLSVPMPGHAPGSGHKEEEEAMQRAMEELEALVLDHDAIFLLTDTRESRWLPTLLATVHGKVAITAALGFDSYLVMRNGPEAQAHSSFDPNSDGKEPPRLGCYFCNDVVGPSDSMKGRTLDQQCTVARPGLAPIASALAVELLASIIQHPQGLHASAPTQDQDGAPDDDLPLGDVPHMIRGHLMGFGQSCMVGTAFKQCTACSVPVVDEFRARGWRFVLEALRDPESIEKVSGLKELKMSMDLATLYAEVQDDSVAEDGDAEWAEI